jgi:hypothetical protein
MWHGYHGLYLNAGRTVEQKVEQKRSGGKEKERKGERKGGRTGRTPRPLFFSFSAFSSGGEFKGFQFAEVHNDTFTRLVYI